MNANGILWGLRALSVIAAVVLAVLFLGPFTPLLDVLRVSDLQAHAAIFFSVTAVLLMLWPRQPGVVLASAVFAASAALEIAQGFTGRGPSLADLAANASGIVIGLFAVLLVRSAQPLAVHGIVRSASGARTTVPPVAAASVGQTL